MDRYAGWMGILLVLAMAPAVSASAEVTTDAYVNLRVRLEVNDQVSPSPMRDGSFSFWNARLRGGLRVESGPLTIQGAVQGAASLGLPGNGSFGIGPVYYNVNDGLTDPGRVSLLELNAQYAGDAFALTAGRMRYSDGNETSTGVAYLDGVKRRRLAERLIGNWDWVNVGRRFDGAAGHASLTFGRIDAFYLRPIAGGVNYQQAHEWIDDLAVFGVTITNAYGTTIPSTELRFSAYQYTDDRPATRGMFWQSPEGKINLTNAVLSALAGNERSDLVLWLAVQGGDWGEKTQSAWAFLGEVGWRFPDHALSPGVRVGYAHSSGWNGESGDHQTFFNMLPTNHKFYGKMDFNAFQNLRNLYAEVLGKPHARVNARLAGHLFWLTRKTDAWYGGSGAFNEKLLGYLARRPASGEDFASNRIGSELDLDVTVAVRGRHKVQFGGAVFWGGDAAKEILTEEATGLWGYLQLVTGI